MLPTIAREDDAVVMIDQRKLPAQEVYVRCKTAAEVARAIKTMVIRGAPAIGVAAAMGIALGMRTQHGDRHAEVRRRVLQDLRADGRHAADRRQSVLGDRADEARRSPRRRRRASRSSRSRIGSIAKRSAIHDEDVASCRAMGAFGADGRAGRRAHPDALQRRRAGDGRLRHGARRHSRRGRSRASTSRCSPTRRGRSCRARG